MLVFPPNNKGITVRIRRGSQYITAPISCNVQPVDNRQYPEYYIPTSANAYGEDSITHHIYTSLIEGYIQIIGDVLVVSNSTNGVLNGEYVIKQYSAPRIGMNGKLDHLQFVTRFLGIKKAGDTKQNNTGNIRFGGGN